MKTLEDVGIDYNNGEYENTMKYPNKSKYKENHIFDEDQTVKWNREEVVRQNELIDLEKKAYSNESNRLNNKLYDDAVNGLMEEYKFNKKQAEKIWNYVYAEKHSHMNDVFYFAGELADIIEEVIKLKNTRGISK